MTAARASDAGDEETMTQREQPPRQDPGARALLVAACIIVVVAGLKAAAGLILPLLAAVFLAMISLPLMNWLETHRVPRPLAVLLTLCVAIAVLAGFVAMVGGSLTQFTQEAPKYRERLETLSHDAIEALQSRGIRVPHELSADLVDPGAVIDIVSRTLRGVAAVLSNAVLVLLTVVFVLFEAAGFSDKLRVAFGRAGSSERFAKIRSEIQHYLGIKTVVSLTTGIAISVAMTVIGVDFPILWGGVAFLMNYIPNLGSILAAIPPILLAIVQLGWGHALAVAIVFVVVNVVLGNFVEPYFMGRRLGLSTLVVFLSLVFWGWVWGPVGMLLSVPLTMVVKIMLENTEDLRWIAVLLDAGAPPAPPPPPAKRRSA